eukprot:759241-Hanusia_phi.AAC.1
MESQHNLAVMYAIGSGVRRHVKKASYWFLQLLRGSTKLPNRTTKQRRSGRYASAHESLMVLLLLQILHEIASGNDVTEYIQSLVPKPQESKEATELVRTYDEVREELAQQV